MPTLKQMGSGFWRNLNLSIDGEVVILNTTLVAIIGVELGSDDVVTYLWNKIL